MSDRPSPALAALADAHGIATTYWSFFGEQVEVPASTLRAILASMGIEAHDDAAVDAALAALDEQPWRRTLPPSIVTRGGTDVVVHVADGHDVTLAIAFEDGGWRDIPVPVQSPTPRSIDGATVWRLAVPLPHDLPLGWHTLHAWQRPFGADHPTRADAAALVVTPHRLPDPPTRPDHGGRGWGLMAQLYSVRSRASWGLGDYADLGDLAATAGSRGADFVLVNPVHAADIVPPIEPSPYLPATRRFLAALYVRPEDIREYAYLPASARARIDALRAPAAALNTDADRLDRDAVWAAKRPALQLVYDAGRSPGRQAALDAFAAREGQPLRDFALWCAVQEHLAAEGEAVAPAIDDIHAPAVERLRHELADVVEFHIWLQWVAADQLERAQAEAKASGMTIGIMHDLAVGVSLVGSDAWSLRDMYAHGITVGAPPDMYNSQGQNWDQPPWLPGALAESGYAPLRDMVRTLLRGAGALRIDHVIGLFRLWWIPAGQSAAAGTYVRYDHEAMIGVILLEAHRAGAVLIGEDLGLVEPWVRDYLADRGVLGTSVLWFETEDGALAPPEHYRRGVLATVNTHDLPPTAGYLAGEHIALREQLGLLDEPVAQARAAAGAEREGLLEILRRRGLLVDEATDAGEAGAPDEEDVIRAMHVLLTASPSRLLGVSLVDAVGERRAQNVPGTDKEYPNWQIPLAGPDGEAVLLDDLAANRRFLALADAVDAALRRGA